VLIQPSSLLKKIYTVHSFKKRKREQRSRHLLTGKMFLLSYLQDLVYLFQMNVEAFFSCSVETLPIITAQWNSIRLTFSLESEYDDVRLLLHTI